MISEVLRLLLTLVLTAVGYQIGTNLGDSVFGATVDPASTRLFGAVLGAGFGYVIGGVFGRSFTSRLDVLGGRFLPRTTGPELFTGGFGAIVGLTVGFVASVPIVVLAPPAIGWTTAALVVVALGTAGARVFALRSHDLLAVAGLRPAGPLVVRRPEDNVRSYLIDSSAAIDGRILELARTNLIDGRIWIPFFVIDELQGLADAGEKSRRRRGRRGLEVLDALRSVGGSEVSVLDDAVPEFEDDDAKLLALGERTGSILATTDTHLAKAAEIRGIRVLNPGLLGESLKPQVAVGEVIDVPVSKEGSEPGQGVGYLDDGTMVVIENAAKRVGSEIKVEVTSTTRTAVGRMLFGRPADS